ncbi:MAG: hypothetical protein ACRDD1_21495, partial [Planctomycetia bacterium]
HPGGGRIHYPVDWISVSVAKPYDLLGVKLTPTLLELKPGETKKIDVEIIRAPGFKGNVTLDALFRHLSIFCDSLPPGVTMNEKESSTILGGETTKGHISFTAAADAKPASEQLVAVMANVSMNFVLKFTYAGDPVKVTVLKP